MSEKQGERERERNEEKRGGRRTIGGISLAKALQTCRERDSTHDCSY